MPLSYKAKKNFKIAGLILLGAAIIGTIAWFASPKCKQWMQTQWDKFLSLFKKK